MFNQQEIQQENHASDNSNPTQTPVVGAIETFIDGNDVLPQVDWTHYFIPARPILISKIPDSTMKLAKEKERGETMGPDNDGDDEGVAINNISVVPFHQGGFNHDLAFPFSFNNTVVKSCAMQHLAAQDYKDTCSLTDIQPQPSPMIVDPQGWPFDQATEEFLVELLHEWKSIRSGRRRGEHEPCCRSINGFAERDGYDEPPVTTVAGSSTQLDINNDDISNINTMVSLSNDTEDDADNSNIRYQIRTAGRTLYLTAIQLEHRFMGVKSAIWGFWKNKKRVSKHKVREFLTHNGVEGFYQEIMWQFLDDDEHSELIKRRKDGNLSGFAFKNC